MRRLFLVALLVLVLPAAGAAAQTSDQIAPEVELRGYYWDGTADITIDQLEELVDRYPAVAFVALRQTPSGGADLLADEVLAAVGSRDTVIVLTADEAGAASAVFGDEALDDAFDRAFATAGDSYLRDFEEVAGALEETGAMSPSEDAGGPAPGGGGFSVWWVVAAGAVLVGYVMWRGSRADRRAVERRFDEARSEIRQQMAVIANQILEVSDRVDLADHPEATAHYRRAAEVYRSAEDRLEKAGGTEAFETLADDLDDARWELAAAEALLAGEAVPDRPQDEPPEPCFFDPTHGAGTEAAEIATAAGMRTVRVCTDDAARLRRGERPEPRTVTVGGRSVPAPAAPRSHGGRGMDALDVFSILVGGMGDAAHYRWGGARRRGGLRRLGGVLPGGFGGAGGMSARSRGTASRPRPSSGSRSVGRSRRSR